jgi:outer membrane protein assembly factor BamB
MAAEQPARPRRVELLSADPDFDVKKAHLEVKAVDVAAGLTLGAVGSGYRVSTVATFPTSFLRIDFDPNDAPWIDPFTIRVFVATEDERSFRPIWQSGANVGLGFIWSRVDGPGTYVAIGLPRDRLLLETLRQIAATRRMTPTDPRDARRLTVEPLERLIDLGGDDLDELRDRLAGFEVLTGADTFKEVTMPRGKDFGIAAPLLPGGLREFTGLRGVVARLTPTADGLPEEQLFFPPYGSPPLPWPPVPKDVPPFYHRPDMFRPLPLVFDLMPWIYCLIRGTDWPMYMHDAEHTGRASCSSIDSTNVSTLRERFKVPVNGRVNSQPAIVGGRIYVGTMDATGTGIGGVLYKINLSTGVIEGTFTVDDGPARQGKGIACTPAVVDGKVYFSAVNGKVYCVDAATMTQDWVVNLRKQDLAHNQPVDHGADYATGWSSPVVVNGFLYVGSGEGEHDSFGYVYCINTKNGHVKWLFCTDKFVDPNNPGNENQPNIIPPGHWIGPGLPPAPFIVAAANPAHPGSAPWSSAAYDAGLNRIYIGTGNAEPDDPLPDPRYASGCISLDASTGEFKGFFQPAPADSYRAPGDLDVDVPGGPTIFTRDWAGSFPVRQRLVGIGSKNGSYFLLEANGLALDARRQLLPYDVNGNPFPNVDPPNNNNPRENKSGMFGTATVDPGRERLFIGLGGYSAAIDNTTTPFIRAMRWTDLADAWPTVGNNPPKYSLAQPPVYSTAGEAGLTNATSVNDVVFAGTTKPGLYAFHADTGLNLWSAPMFGPGSYCFGSAISGSYIVAGTGPNVYIYSL